MRRFVVALALPVLVLAAACGGSKSATTTTSASSTSTTTTSLSGSSTSTSTTTSTTTTTPGQVTVQVFFQDQEAFRVGRQPFTRAVDRAVDASAPAEGALRELFAGPTPDESAGGLRFVASEATGFTDLTIVDGTARVRLVGGCNSGGSTFSVAEEIQVTLRQFPQVQSVKIFDPDGNTEQPDKPGDSIPFCLEP